MRNSGWMQHIADSADLEGEMLPGVPVVELAGDRRLLIERHGGVTQYSGECICIKVRYGQVCVRGSALELTRMTREQLVISGRIDCVELQRRECHGNL